MSLEAKKEKTESDERDPSEFAIVTSETALDFLLAEYQRLCAELAELDKESSHCLTFSLTGSAAIWAWLLANPSASMGHLVGWMPLALTGLFWARWGLLQKSLGEIGVYLKGVERFYFADFGWENHVCPKQKRTGMRGKGVGTSVYFGVLMTACAIMLGFFNRHRPAEDTAEAKRQQALGAAIEKLSEAMKAATR